MRSLPADPNLLIGLGGLLVVAVRLATGGGVGPLTGAAAGVGVVGLALYVAGRRTSES